MTPALLTEFSLYVELLALSLEGGLDFLVSLKKLIHINPHSQVSQKLRCLLTQLALGHSKEEAFLVFQKTWDHPMIQNFCQTVLYGWKQGISISHLLKEQADTIRTETILQMERDIQKKQLKLLLPLFLLVLPAVIIVLIMPLMIQLIQLSF